MEEEQGGAEERFQHESDNNGVSDAFGVDGQSRSTHHQTAEAISKNLSSPPEGRGGDSGFSECSSCDNGKDEEPPNGIGSFTLFYNDSSGEQSWTDASVQDDLQEEQPSSSAIVPTDEQPINNLMSYSNASTFELEEQDVPLAPFLEPTNTVLSYSTANTFDQEELEPGLEALELDAASQTDPQLYVAPEQQPIQVVDDGGPINNVLSLSTASTFELEEYPFLEDLVLEPASIGGNLSADQSGQFSNEDEHELESFPPGLFMPPGVHVGFHYQHLVADVQ